MSAYYNLEAMREYCNCGNLLNHEATFRHKSGDREIDIYYTEEIFDFLTCPACNEVTLVCYSASINSNEEYDSKVDLYREFRRTVIHSPNKQLHPSVPRSIVEVISQAQAVLYKSPRASFILSRAVLEEICNEFNIPTEASNKDGKIRFVGLGERLTQLFRQEKMPEGLTDIIRGIKELGNKGAHSKHLFFAKQAKAEDASNLLILVNYVIERLYIDTHRKREAKQVLEDLKLKFSPSS